MGGHSEGGYIVRVRGVSQREISKNEGERGSVARVCVRMREREVTVSMRN